MGGRIITLQRRVRELGRLRAGLTSTNAEGKTYPRASRTWILTSPNRVYIEAAAELWGGQVEQWQPQGKGAAEWRVITEHAVIDAILPPGDPISQWYEMWTAGGCQRRCDGETDTLSGKPCLCRAQWGDDFHEVPLLGPDKRPQRCQVTTRLSLFLPDLPDIGVWRVETHGYWPSVHITGYVETIKGLVGPQPMVPVRLSIEPRTKVRDGKTSHYVEIVVSAKSNLSFGEIVAAPASLAIGGPADTRTIDAGDPRQAIGTRPAAEDRPAIAAAPTEPQQTAQASRAWHEDINAAKTIEDVRRLWREAVASGEIDDVIKARLEQRAAQLDAEHALPARKKEIEQASNAQPVQAGPEPDRQATWMAVLAVAGERGWSTTDVSQAFREWAGVDVSNADGHQIAAFLDRLRSEAVTA